MENSVERYPCVKRATPVGSRDPDELGGLCPHCGNPLLPGAQPAATCPLWSLVKVPTSSHCNSGLVSLYSLPGREACYCWVTSITLLVNVKFLFAVPFVCHCQSRKDDLFKGAEGETRLPHYFSSVSGTDVCCSPPRCVTSWRGSSWSSAISWCTTWTTPWCITWSGGSRSSSCTSSTTCSRWVRQARPTAHSFPPRTPSRQLCQWRLQPWVRTFRGGLVGTHVLIRAPLTRWCLCVPGHAGAAGPQGITCPPVGTRATGRLDILESVPPWECKLSDDRGVFSQFIGNPCVLFVRTLNLMKRFLGLCVYWL